VKLQAKTRYGVRAVFDLAYHNVVNQSTQAKDIARREGIPLRHPGGRSPFLRRWRTGR